MQLKLFEIQPIEIELTCFHCCFSSCETVIEPLSQKQIKEWYCSNWNVYEKANVWNITDFGYVILYQFRKAKNCKYFKKEKV